MMFENQPFCLFRKLFCQIEEGQTITRVHLIQIFFRFSQRLCFSQDLRGDFDFADIVENGCHTEQFDLFCSFTALFSQQHRQHRDVKRVIVKTFTFR